MRKYYLREAIVIRSVRKACLVLLLGYLLGVSDGYITLWKDDSPVPLEVFPCRAEMLPPCDQQLLAKGIHISDRLELNRLLEDYLS